MTTKALKWRVAEILEARQMSTAEFAERSSLTYNQALALRRGSTTRVGLETLDRVCKALGCTPSDLFLGVKDEARKGI